MGQPWNSFPVLLRQGPSFCYLLVSVACAASELNPCIPGFSSDAAQARFPVPTVNSCYFTYRASSEMFARFSVSEFSRIPISSI